MPQSITIAAFVFGAVLILLSLIVGKFELFGAKVDGTVGKAGRVIAFVLGIFLIGKGLNIDSSPEPAQHPANSPPASSGDRPAARTEQATASPPPTQPSRDFEHSVPGVWYARVPAANGGALDVTVHYFADHTFNGTQSAFVGGYGGTQRVSGTWSIRPLSADEFILTLDYFGAGPVSSKFRVLDDNSVENEDLNYVAHRTSR